MTPLEYRTYIPYVKRIKQESQIRFLGQGLNGKWEVYGILSTNPIFKIHLPKTAIYRETKQLFHWLSVTPIILKPTGGSHGNGVIKVHYDHHRYEIVGRTFDNKKIHEIVNNKNQLIKAIQSIIQRRRYAIQQYLQLTTSQNEPYDIRVLVQKNEKGLWETTGMAARIGDADNITSNLHGGGYVDSAEKIIQTEFSPYQAKEILAQIQSLAKTIPPFIEQSHGLFVELGLDLGIDKQGKVWIIEVNSKPGRSVFSILGDEQASYKSVIQPILYTRYLSKNQILGGNVK
ncbi:YheC/YheD family protein [Tepidibacillus marianensis]|uniref:YheC/YheD family endospore coat-associated protein n=1 Tax=Tepidibacillus marianensis TaxID=3131995 RepID=UPI0030D00BAD